MPERAIIGGIITQILLILGLCIREYFKHRDWKKKNGGIGRIENDIKEIKTCTKSLNGKAQKNDKDMGIIKIELKNVHQNCSKQVGVFSKSIAQNSRDILSLHREKADK